MAVARDTGLRASIALRRAKLLPPQRSGAFLGRPRLTAALSKALVHPLTLVVAPGGYGKSTILADWSRRLEIPSAWLSLDSADNDLRVWATHLLATIEGATKGNAWAIRSLLDDRTPLIPAELAVAASNDLLDSEHDVVLVLDDFHQITDPTVCQSVAELLRYPLPNLHLIIASREEPEFLPLSALRARDQLVELRAADLRFSASETEEYLASTLSPELAEERARRIFEETDGWPAGLSLTAMALRNGNYHEESGSTSRLHAMEFLFDEMLLRQSPDVQQFLVITSIVERVSVALASRIVGGVFGDERSIAAMLDRLARSNDFVVRLGDQRDLYAYHHLLRELLRTRFEHVFSPFERNQFHRNASNWYATHGEIDAAIVHALAGNDPDGAARIVERTILKQPDLEGFQANPRWLSMLPPELIERRPGLQLVLAWQVFSQGRPAALRPPVIAAGALLERGEHDLDEREMQIIEGTLAVLSIYAGLPDGLLTTANESADRALSLLPPDHEVARGMVFFFKGAALQGLGRADEALAGLSRELQEAPEGAYLLRWRLLASLCEVRLSEGDVNGVLQDAEIMLAMSLERQDAFSEAWAHARLGISYLLLGRFDEAEEHLQISRPLWKRMHRAIWRDAMVALQLTLELLNRSAESAQVAEELTVILQRSGDAENIPFARSAQARCAVLRGRIDEAAAWLGSSNELLSALLPFRVETDSITRLKVRLAIGTTEQLDLLLTEADDLLRATQAIHGRMYEIEIRLVIAAASLLRGYRARAAAEREIVIRLAATSGFGLIFIELRRIRSNLLDDLFSGEWRMLPDWLRSAIHRDASGETGGSRAEVIATVSRRIDRTQNERAVEPLSDRELEILALIAERRSNKEIAEELSISPLTVKRHASNLFGKLGAGGRRQAVERALELRILVGRPVS
jgi:LuxR family maltose regulon positive regulatory protein